MVYKRAERAGLITRVVSFNKSVIDFCGRLNIPRWWTEHIKYAYRDITLELLDAAEYSALRYSAASYRRAEYVVHITGDQVFVDPDTIQAAARLIRKHDAEYTWYGYNVQGFPVRIYQTRALAKLIELRQHGPIIMDPEWGSRLVRNQHVKWPAELTEPEEKLNYSVDTEEDRQRAILIYDALYKKHGEKGFYAPAKEVLACASELLKSGAISPSTLSEKPDPTTPGSSTTPGG